MTEKRLLPVAVVTVVLAVFAAAGYLLPEDTKAVPERIAIINSGGPVVFEHQKHVKLEKDCATCHHDMAPGQKAPLACKSCHGVELDKDFVKAHQKAYPAEACAVCHHYRPGKADWGHAAHGEQFGVECTSCHHEDKSIEETPSNCADCHEAGAAPSRQKAEAGTPPSFADAVHARCAACHEEWFGANAARNCSRCHFDKAPESIPEGARLHKGAEFKDCASCHGEGVDKLIPSRMEAQHRSCMECHEKAKKGPTHHDCGQCHMK